jgi:hypothetical protein
MQSGKCLVHPGIIRKFIFVESFKADGSINGIDLTTAFGKTQIQALINQSDNALRWHITDEASTFATERADPLTETVDNIDRIIAQGPRVMSADFLASGTELESKINGNRCVDMSVYMVDDANGLNGVVTRDNFFDPIRLERNSFGKLVFPTEASVFKVSFSTTWQKNVKDGNVKVLPFSSHGTDLLNERGLVDIKQSGAASVSATTATIRFTNIDGSAQGTAFTGLVAGDFVLTDTTIAGVVAVSSAVENPDGTYLLTFAAQTTGDLGTITATKTSFDFGTGSITFL